MPSRSPDLENKVSCILHLDEIKTDKIELNKFHASEKDPFY
jgi:isopropylmalate/homocitrate/citramalate synthase